jgi:hypothetical protein
METSPTIWLVRSPLVDANTFTEVLPVATVQMDQVARVSNVVTQVVVALLLIQIKVLEQPTASLETAALGTLSVTFYKMCCRS